MERDQTWIQRGGWWALLAAAGLMLTYGFIATRTTLFDRDEPRFSQASVEMLTSGNYLYPTFDGELRADKPILIYWLQTLSLRALGPGELAVRLWSILGAAAAGLFTFWIGRKLFGPGTGLAALGMLATTPLMVMIGMAATADGVLLAAILAAMAVLTRVLLTGQAGLPEVLALGLALGAAQLAKGPVGLAIPALAAVGMAWLSRRSEQAPQEGDSEKNRAGRALMKVVGWGGLMGVGIFVLWAWPANVATGGEFARLGLGRHVLGRALNPMEGHGGSGWQYLALLPLYLGVMVVGFFPWTLHLLGAGSALWGGRVGGAAGRALLMGWVALPLLLMSLVATKLPHYVLPIWPALALAVAGTLAAWRRGELTLQDRTLLHRGGILFTPVAVGLVGALAAGPWVLKLPALRWPCLLVATLLAWFSYRALVYHLRGRFIASAVTAGLGMVITLLLGAGLLLPAIDALKPAPILARIIREKTGPEVPVYTCGFDEPSLYFYLNRPPIRNLALPRLSQLKTAEDVRLVALWSTKPSPAVLVIRRDVLDKVEELSGPLGLRRLGQARGLDLQKGDGVLEVLALERGQAGQRSGPRGESWLGDQVEHPASQP